MLCFNYFYSRIKNPKALKGQAYQPTDSEHIANIVTHAVCIYLTSQIVSIRKRNTEQFEINPTSMNVPLLVLFLLSLNLLKLSMWDIPSNLYSEVTFCTKIKWSFKTCDFLKAVLIMRTRPPAQYQYMFLF